MEMDINLIIKINKNKNKIIILRVNKSLIGWTLNLVKIRLILNK
jgi:hypothetical protein